MKKFISIFILTFNIYLFSNPMFLYRDTYWGENKTSFFSLKKNIFSLSSDIKDFQNCAFYENDIMIGQKTSVIYFFKEEKLKAISYNLPYSEKNLNKLISKFNNYKKYYAEKMPEEILNSYNKTDLHLLAIEDVIGTENLADSYIGNFILNSQIKENKSCFYIINKDPVTNCYILCNLFYDDIIVIYTEKYEEQF